MKLPYCAYPFDFVDFETNCPMFTKCIVEIYAIRGTQPCTFKFPTLSNTNITDARTYEVGETLAPHYIIS